MKIIKLFSIPLYMAFMLFGISCENADVQKLSTNDQVKIEPRGDCDECPDNDQCCCAVWLKPNDDEAQLLICGSTNGTSNCFGGSFGNCPAFNGLSYAFSLDDVEPYGLFCSLLNGPLWISNTSSSDPANVVVSCQNDILNPDTIHLSIPPLGRARLHTINDCELDFCD